METLEWIIDNWETLSFTALLVIICGFALFLYAIWRFIASAVQRGVEDALTNTPQKTNFRPYLMTECVKEGILQAMTELDTIEFKYYDKDGKEVCIKKEYDNIINLDMGKPKD